jgi:hypothetical protein
MICAAGSYAGTWLDNFEDGRADDWEEISGDWDVEDGVYKQTEATAAYQKSIHESEDWTDYTLEVDITILESSAASTSVAAGVLLRSDDTGSFGYRIWIRADSGGFQFSLWENNGYTHVTTQAAEVAALGETYTLKVEIEGNILSAWVDDRSMFEDYTEEADLFPTGRLGLINYNCSVLYDNISVSGDNIYMAVSPTSQSTATAWGAIKAIPASHTQP